MMLARIAVIATLAASPAFGQSATTPYVNGKAVTQSNPLPVADTQQQAPPHSTFTMPAPPSLARWRLDCMCFKANP